MTWEVRAPETWKPGWVEKTLCIMVLCIKNCDFWRHQVRDCQRVLYLKSKVNHETGGETKFYSELRFPPSFRDLSLERSNFGDVKSFMSFVPKFRDVH